MRRFTMLIHGLLGQTLTQVLPDTSLSVAGVDPPDVLIMLLEQLDGSGHKFISTNQAIVMGLTFFSPIRAVFNPRLISFDCQFFLAVQLPISLSALRNLIADSPKGFGPVFAHPEINLLWQLQECLHHPSDHLRSQLVERRLADLFPGLLDKAQGNLSYFLEVMPYHIVASFYSGLAHHRGGLEGQLSDLGRAAIDYRPDQPKRANAFYQKIKAFPQKSEKARQEFSARFKDYTLLLPLLSPDTLNILKPIYEVHQKINGVLTDLESCLSQFPIHTKVPQPPEKTFSLAQEIHRLAAESGRNISRSYFKTSTKLIIENYNKNKN